MSKLKDLTGQTFGKLKVIKRYPQNTKDNHAQWECQCECGKIVVYSGKTLTKGQAISCGCARKKDLTNKRFGRLLVKKYAYSKNGNRYWECKCDCGNTTFVSTSSLNTGNTQSCGCLHHDKILKLNNSKSTIPDMTGKFFGFLEVLDFDQYKTRGKNQEAWYWCKCHKCGSIKSINGHDIRNNKIHSCGCITSYGEELLKQILNEENIQYITQYSFNDLISDKQVKLRFDFAIFNKNQLYCLIEYQGDQHTNKNNPFYSERLKLHDNMKKEYCKKNNIKLLEFNKNNDLKLEIKQLKQEMS